MIWLKKVRKNALPDKDFNIAVYLQEMLEPFDKYLASIKETELTPEIIQDAQFHLYQLMELYIDSRICSRWVTLNPDEKLSSSKTSPGKRNFQNFSFLVLKKKIFLIQHSLFISFREPGLLSESFHQVPANMIQSFKTMLLNQIMIF